MPGLQLNKAAPAPFSLQALCPHLNAFHQLSSPFLAFLGLLALSSSQFLSKDVQFKCEHSNSSVLQHLRQVESWSPTRASKKATPDIKFRRIIPALHWKQGQALGVKLCSYLYCLMHHLIQHENNVTIQLGDQKPKNHPNSSTSI